jgi:hypothetical protein
MPKIGFATAVMETINTMATDQYWPCQINAPLPTANAKRAFQGRLIMDSYYEEQAMLRAEYESFPPKNLY